MSSSQSSQLGKRKRYSKSYLAFKKRIRAELKRDLAVARVPRLNMQDKRVGMPRTKLVTGMYFAQGSTTGAAGNLAGHTFSASSAYDPDRTAAGHQPSLYDFWSSIYNHYVVVSSKIKMTFCYPHDGQIPPMIVGVLLNDDTTLPSVSQIDVNVENGMPHRLLTPGLDTTVVVVNTYDAKQFWQISDIGAKDSIGALVTANPSDEAFFIMNMQAINGAVWSTVYWTAELTYTILFSEPKDRAQS